MADCKCKHPVEHHAAGRCVCGCPEYRAQEGGRVTYNDNPDLVVWDVGFEDEAPPMDTAESVNADVHK